MFGAQQIPAYKTIMKTPRRLPPHSKSNIRLLRVISWGAAIIGAAFVAVFVVANINDVDIEGNALVLAVIPLVLLLLFCWWFIDVAPIASRWLVAPVAILASLGCLVSAWFFRFWVDQLQLAVMFIYSVVVAREAWRQIQALKADQGQLEAP